MNVSVERKVVLFDGAFTVIYVGLGVMMALSFESPADAWWVGAAVAALTALLTAAADRNRAGLIAMFAVGAVGAIALLWFGGTDVLPANVIPIVMVGIAVGVGCNRLQFGVIGSVPEARLRREQSS